MGACHACRSRLGQSRKDGPSLVHYTMTSRTHRQSVGSGGLDEHADRNGCRQQCETGTNE